MDIGGRRIIDMLFRIKAQEVIVENLQAEKEKLKRISEKTNSEDIIEKIARIEKENDSEIDTLVNNRREAMTLIQASDLDAKECSVIFGYYFNGRSFKELANDMHYSYSYIIQLHSRGIAKIEMAIECRKV